MEGYRDKQNKGLLDCYNHLHMLL